ncbi:MAG: TRAP transporter small permease subunit, partial [Candidatus Acidiferrum sp.]
MNPGTAINEELRELSPPRSIGWAGLAARIEDIFVSLSLVIMAILPLAEAALRRTLHVSIPASTSIVQHMVLVVGMLGGAIAAREQRLLTLSNLGESSLRGRTKNISRMLTSAVSAVICGFLSLASFQFVQTERDAAKILVFGIPIWVVEIVLPAGFAVIALRILWHTSQNWRPRIAATVFALFLGILVWQWPATGHHFVGVALGVLFIVSLLGVPALVTLGGAALVLFWGVDQPIASIPVAHYALVINPTLPTLPLFALAGYFLAEGGAPRRLVRVFYALFGQFRGGPA